MKKIKYEKDMIWKNKIKIRIKRITSDRDMAETTTLPGSATPDDYLAPTNVVGALDFTSGAGKLKFKVYIKIK